MSVPQNSRHRTVAIATSATLALLLSLGLCQQNGVAGDDSTSSEEAAKLSKRAVDLMETGENVAAARLLSRVCQLAPNVAGAHRGYAMALLNLGRYQEAVAQALKATELDSKDVDNWISLGTAYAEMANKKSSIDAFERGLRCNPTPEQADAIRKTMEIIRAAKPADFVADPAVASLTDKAAKYAEAADFTAAEPLFKKACELAPNDSDVQSNYAWALSMVGKPQEALQHRLKAIAISGEDVKSLDLLAFTYACVNNETAAMATMRKAIDLAPDNAETYVRFGVILEFFGKCDESIVQLARATEIEKDHFNAWNSLGATYEQLGDFRNAQKCFERCLQLATDAHGKALANENLQGVKEAMKLSPASKPDYLTDTDRVEHGYVRWENNQMPLKVYMEPGDGIKWFQPGYQRAIKEAFTEWANAPNSKVSFVFVNQPESADIITKWITQATSLSTTSEAGETHLDNAGGSLKRTVIRVLTRPPLHDFGALLYQPSEKWIKRIALHEIGHALGLSHSACTNDIMYFYTPLTIKSLTQEPVLSARDRKTLDMLYNTR